MVLPRRKEVLVSAAIDEINNLFTKYDLPSKVLSDIHYRVTCCSDEAYIKQQLRYLKNLVEAGHIPERSKIAKICE
ncbi:DUF6877 family protein [Enterococcus larvae]|uniref:DUF6877 family protein n=1 Tax=Enterococcus larvae TaxID=2794352 RepID=UPI003F2F55C8